MAANPPQNCNLKPDRWQQIEELFHKAFDLAGDEREAFLQSIRAVDQSLAEEIASLLANAYQPLEIIDRSLDQEAIRLIALDEDDSLVGQTVDHYSIIAPLGAGGMGEVYLAQDSELDRKVALKLLHSAFVGDEDRVRRLRQEAKAASALNHPNIITIHEIGQTASLHFIAMEFIQGETLRHHTRGSRAPLRDAVNVCIQVADALAAAHQSGIIHRDIKPENIMIRDDGYIKVLDFGIAKLKEDRRDTDSETIQQGESESSALWGTVSYMSPEQAKGEQIDHRTDLFSLGVVLYEMVAGQRPFQSQSHADVLQSVLESEPNPLSDHRPNAPALLENILSRALNKNREERYQSAGQMLADLQKLRNHLDRAASQQALRAAASRRLPYTATSESLTQRATRRWWFLALSVIASFAALIDAMFVGQGVGWRARDSLIIFFALASAVVFVYLRGKAVALRPSLRSDGAFRGLVSFGEADSDCFYGRQEDTLALFNMVARRGFRFGLLYGNSGCGKTSLLTAGLIARLRDEGFTPLYCRSYKDPLAAVMQECKKLGDIDAQQPVDYLRQLGEQCNSTIVIICDQFEEFFVNFRTESERRPFVSFVEECYRQGDAPVKFLFSFRGDYLDRMLRAFDRCVPELLMSDKRYELWNLSEEQAAEIIEKSASAAALPLDAALCRRVASDLVRDDRVLASELQIVGLQLQRHDIHSLEAYTRAGGKELLGQLTTS